MTGGTPMTWETAMWGAGKVKQIHRIDDFRSRGDEWKEIGCTGIMMYAQYTQ